MVTNVGTADGGAAGVDDRIDPGFPGRKRMGAKARSAGNLPGKLLRPVNAGEASIIPAGHSLIAGYGQGVLST